MRRLARRAHGTRRGMVDHSASEVARGRKGSGLLDRGQDGRWCSKCNRNSFLKKLLYQLHGEWSVGEQERERGNADAIAGFQRRPGWTGRGPVTEGTGSNWNEEYFDSCCDLLTDGFGVRLSGEQLCSNSPVGGSQGATVITPTLRVNMIRGPFTKEKNEQSLKWLL